jgi:hypothetical protein
MDVMWRAREPITGRTCLNRLDYQTCYGEEPLYNAVMLILANLRKKRLLTRVTLAQDGHPGGPAWKYQVQISREDYLAAVIRGALACAPDQARGSAARPAARPAPLTPAPVTPIAAPGGSPAWTSHKTT